MSKSEILNELNWIELNEMREYKLESFAYGLFHK